MATMHFFKPLSSRIYQIQYRQDPHLMNLLEGQLKKIDTAYSLDTTLSGVAEIDQWKAQLMQDCLSRLSIAPSRKASLSAQIEEIKSFLKYDQPEDKAPNPQDSLYMNRYRKIAYNHLVKGDDITLRNLGYLFLNEHWQQENELESFVEVTIITTDTVRFRLNAVAEGAAFAYHLPFLENLLEETSQQILTNPTDNSLSFYSSIAHQLYNGDMKIGNVIYSDPSQFIEAKRMEGLFKGKIFFRGLTALVKQYFGKRATDPFAQSLLEYCAKKLEDNSPAEKLLDLFDHPEQQIQLERDMRARLKTLPLDDQRDYYEALHTHYTNERRDVLNANRGTQNRARLQYYSNFYNAQIEDAKLEIDRINRDMIKTGISSKEVYPSETRQTNEELYRDIIGTLFQVGKFAEQYPSLYQEKDEEGIRDVFLVCLNIRRYASAIASGESFNGAGKTDIILKSVTGDNIFIAECKFWNGPTKLQAALDQLIDRYITWRDTRAALLVFVKNGNFTAVLSTVKDTVKTHRYFVEAKTANNETSLPYTFRHRLDPDRRISLEIIVFPFPPLGTFRK